jgi:hypothetical protein
MGLDVSIGIMTFLRLDENGCIFSRVHLQSVCVVGCPVSDPYTRSGCHFFTKQDDNAVLLLFDPKSVPDFVTRENVQEILEAQPVGMKNCIVYRDRS